MRIVIRSDVAFPLRSPFLHFSDVLGMPFVYLTLHAFEEFGGMFQIMLEMFSTSPRFEPYYDRMAFIRTTGSPFEIFCCAWRVRMSRVTGVFAS
jgi:hypothetical protein